MDYSKQKRRMWVLPSPSGDIVRGEKSSLIIGRFIFKTINDVLLFRFHSSYNSFVLKVSSLSLDLNSTSDYNFNVLKNSYATLDLDSWSYASVPRPAAGTILSLNVLSSFQASVVNNMNSTIEFESESDFVDNFVLLVKKLRGKSAIFRAGVDPDGSSRLYMTNIFKAKKE